MGEAGRNPETKLVAVVKPEPGPAAERGRPAPEVHGDVEGRAAHDAHVLALRVRVDLVVHAAQRARRRTAQVVLDEGLGHARLGPIGLRVGFGEIAPVVAEHGRLDEQDPRQLRGREFRQRHGSPFTGACIRPEALLCRVRPAGANP